MQLTKSSQRKLKNSEIIGSYMYERFGKQFTLFSESQTRLSFISKEKDIESELSDFGVRKYDNEIGRFTSIDPLWEKYYSWTPYHYCSNNPVMGSDPGGMADFWIWNQSQESGFLMNDGNDDGKFYVTISSNYDDASEIIGNTNSKEFYSKLQEVSLLLPDKETRQELLCNHYSAFFGEATSVCGLTLDTYFYGGRNDDEGVGDVAGNGTNELKNALVQADKAKSDNEIKYIAHDHPLKSNSIFNYFDKATQRYISNSLENPVGSIIFFEDTVNIRANNYPSDSKIVISRGLFGQVGK
jgi:RHS repeat-associated protein